MMIRSNPNAGPAVIARLRQIMPNQANFTLVSQSVGNVTFRGVRKEIDIELLATLGAVVGAVWATFQLWQEAQAVAPVSGDKFLDAAGDRWEVKLVGSSLGGYAHDCHCLKDL